MVSRPSPTTPATARKRGQPQLLSTRSIVKEKWRKPQLSQDQAVATYYHSRQRSGKNQNREYFTVFLGRVFPGISKMDFGFFPAFQNERQNPRTKSYP
jgi:hypothetical protein